MKARVSSYNQERKKTIMKPVGQIGGRGINTDMWLKMDDIQTGRQTDI